MTTNVTYLFDLGVNRRPASSTVSQVNDQSAVRTTDESLPARVPPLPQSQAATEVPQPTLDQAVNEVNKFVQSIKRELHFRVDEDSGRTVITVTDSETDEVIRQLPPEEILSLAKMIREQLAEQSENAGLLLEAEG